jgi:pyruvate kinase
MPRTKIVCTIGPASRSEDIMRGLIRAGMSAARINFSHGKPADHDHDIGLVRSLAEQEHRVVAVIADLQGPKFRVGEIAGGQTLLQAGDEFVLTTRAVPGGSDAATLPHAELVHELTPGDGILLDDGLLELKVLSTTDTDVLTHVVTGGVLRSHKGVSLIGGRLQLPAVTDKDREDLSFALAHGVDYIAQSFVRRPEDVLDLRQSIKKLGASTPIIAKIEKAEALADFESILAVSDGVMVARGDLGVETPLAQVPVAQKRIIRACNRAAKPVITATQMLESMTWNPRPTRAEVSDVANAIIDGTDAVMLSGETAVGQYPLETVQTMSQVADATELAFPFDLWLRETVDLRADSVTEAISQATCDMAAELHAAAIVSPTLTGLTARAIAHHRPRTPIVAVTPSDLTCRQLALVWGVRPYLISQYHNTDEMMQCAHAVAQDTGIAAPGDLFIVTAGVPIGSGGRTNMIQVHEINRDSGELAHD